MSLDACDGHVWSFLVKLEVSLPAVYLLLYRFIDQAAVVAEAIALQPLVLSAAATAALVLGLVLCVSLLGCDLGA